MRLYTLLKYIMGWFDLDFVSIILFSNFCRQTHFSPRPPDKLQLQYISHYQNKLSFVDFWVMGQLPKLLSVWEVALASAIQLHSIHWYNFPKPDQRGKTNVGEAILSTLTVFILSQNLNDLFRSYCSMNLNMKPVSLQNYSSILIKIVNTNF